eukprot:4995781-Pleurochrysis_carterae.AAC.1
MTRCAQWQPRCGSQMDHAKKQESRSSWPNMVKQHRRGVYLYDAYGSCTHSLPVDTTFRCAWAASVKCVAK